MRARGEQRWFVLKIPQGDTNGVGEDDVDRKLQGYQPHA